MSVNFFIEGASDTPRSLSKRNSKRGSKRKKSSCHRASETANPGKSLGPGRRADRQAFVVLRPPCPSGGSSASWVPRPRIVGSSQTGVSSFLAKLSMSINAADTTALLSASQILMEHGDSRVGFLDDSMSSLVQRCGRIASGRSCVEIMDMVHLMQLVCKCTR